MRRPDEDHLRQPWKAHAHAAGFDLLDVWRFPIRLPAERSLADFLAFLRRVQGRFRDGRSPAATLFRLRRGLGRVFGWDREDGAEAGSGSVEAQAGGRVSFLGFDSVYVAEDEVLFELENETVHALMHIGRVALATDADAAAVAGNGDWVPQLAVYARRKGWLGRVYMAVISPFRHYVVYPEMMRAVERAWREETEGRAPIRERGRT